MTEHKHMWTTTSPMRCVTCHQALIPWWRRLRLRVFYWIALARSEWHLRKKRS